MSTTVFKTVFIAAYEMGLSVQMGTFYVSYINVLSTKHSRCSFGAEKLNFYFL